MLLPAMAEARLTVFAAASLKTALDEVVQAYNKDVVVSYGGSGLLARQVAAGAPADVVILANAQWMDQLADAGHIIAGSQVDLLSNRLVLIGAAGAPPLQEASVEALRQRLDGGRLAIGHRASVPAGIYGHQWLEAAGVMPALSGSLAETENVRAALALVSRGEVPLGLVYATDARAEPRVAVIYEVPPQMHEPIRYPAAIVAGGQGDEARSFVAFLVSETAGEIFFAHGFLPVEATE